ncbi:MAG TPA: asparaginase domain-containing protein [Candidatus Sulfotelmatobacter sp.]|jgi:L-asparaginase|nr:asparaginase domain-containing protein [Candidatus Sulfotelmatobacter sp.]
MKILFLQTGGTIDKDYPKRYQGYHFEIATPAIIPILEKVNPNFTYEVDSILKKDSMDITSADRDKIYQACKKARDDKIIITHGTDSMVQTAEKLSSIRDKVIILTGSLRPEKFVNSDAMFNIGTAVGAINVLANGVYIAMNGRIYTWDNCVKTESGVFIEKF